MQNTSQTSCVEWHKEGWVQIWLNILHWLICKLLKGFSLLVNLPIANTSRCPVFHSAMTTSGFPKTYIIYSTLQLKPDIEFGELILFYSFLHCMDEFWRILKAEFLSKNIYEFFKVRILVKEYLWTLWSQNSCQRISTNSVVRILVKEYLQILWS